MIICNMVQIFAIFNSNSVIIIVAIVNADVIVNVVNVNVIINVPTLMMDVHLPNSSSQ